MSDPADTVGVMEDQIDPAPVDPVGDALTRVRAGLADLAGARLWARSDGQSRDLVAQLAELSAVVQSTYLTAVRDLDSRPGAVAGAVAGKGAVTFLIHRCRISPGQAGLDVAAARAVDPDGTVFPQLGAALAAGQVQRAHVDVAVRALTKIPTRLLKQTDPEDPDQVTGAQRVDALISEHARVFPADRVQRLAARILDHLAPDRRERFDPDAHTRRELHTAIDSTGMLVGTFQLDPASAATVKAALDVYSRPDPTRHAITPNGQQTLTGDDRTPTQRRADALTTIARLSLTHTNTNKTPSAPHTHITIIAAPEHLTAAHTTRQNTTRHDSTRQQTSGQQAGGQQTGGQQAGGSVPAVFARTQEPVGRAECLQTGPLTTGTFARLGCDALLQAVILSTSGAVLNLGRTVRTVTAAQRKALTARDQGCVIPGCTAPLAACDAHHIHWWRHGGNTDLQNLVLLCTAHHSAIHAGTWTLTIINGIPWVIPPRWVDPQQQPIRNTYPTATHHADHLGHQLRLWHDPPPHPPDG
jgi:Domain of unknown function (DUF222)